jgi:hypothetical protein
MLSLVATAVFLYGILVLALFVSQRRILFVPGARRPDPSEVPDGLDGLEVVHARTEDDLELEGWWKPPAPGKPSVLYFQGNGGHIGMRADKAAMLAGHGFGVLLAGYRAYGGNPGRPSEDGFAADARAWLSRIRALGIADADLVIYGESLGSGVSAKLALEAERAGEGVRGLVLEAPYTAITDIAAAKYWFVPVRLLILDKFDTKSIISNIKAPLLILHGKKDAVISSDYGSALFDRAQEPKAFALIPEAGHTNLFVSGGLDPVIGFIQDPLGFCASNGGAE